MDYELNMDMAPGITGAPRLHAGREGARAAFEAAPWSLEYFRHQRDGQFWRSPVRPLSEIKVPVL